MTYSSSPACSNAIIDLRKDMQNIFCSEHVGPAFYYYDIYPETGEVRCYVEGTDILLGTIKYACNHVAYEDKERMLSIWTYNEGYTFYFKTGDGLDLTDEYVFIFKISEGFNKLFVQLADGPIEERDVLVETLAGYRINIYGSDYNG